MIEKEFHDLNLSHFMVLTFLINDLLFNEEKASRWTVNKLKKIIKALYLRLNSYVKGSLSGKLPPKTYIKLFIEVIY